MTAAELRMVSALESVLSVTQHADLELLGCAAGAPAIMYTL